MALQYKENYKNLVGKPNIVGRDVLDFVGTPIYLVAATTSATNRAGNSIESCARDGVLNYIKADVGAVLPSGQVNVAVLKNLATIASGSFTTSSLRFKEWVFGTDQNFAGVTVASGDQIEVRYSVPSLVNAARPLLVKVGLTYVETL